MSSGLGKYTVRFPVLVDSPGLVNFRSGNHYTQHAIIRPNTACYAICLLASASASAQTYEKQSYTESHEAMVPVHI